MQRSVQKPPGANLAGPGGLAVDETFHFCCTPLCLQ